MGSDNLVSLPKWKNYKLILRDYQIYVYPRPGYENTDLATHPSVTHHHDPANGTIGHIYTAVYCQKEKRTIFCSRCSAGVY